ncbi:hypothetical protein [Roseibacillus persicicus]|uniref:PrgI family protein n=1 Tax=Roseibacillus persicicus TaxID=454148 RepID=A0A918TNH7_9BACT|nr:hypothetical protein [Roseibacillus persicicus]GHC55938.1 hypothetical protein GCM10007100_23500 [Roseibacillus persicicus]
MKSSIQVHPVISGESQGPTAWGLSVRQTFVFGGSVAVGFVAYSLLAKLGVGSMIALIVAGLFPLIVFLYFLTLVVRKPATYARNWREWQHLRLSQKPLLEIQIHTQKNHEI